MKTNYKFCRPFGKLRFWFQQFIDLIECIINIIIIPFGYHTNIATDYGLKNAMLDCKWRIKQNK